MNTWDVLENPPKQYCLSTSYLQDNKIFLCGGFSSIQEETFCRHSEVFVYNIRQERWFVSEEAYQISVIGCMAFAYGSKVLLLGGMSDLHTSSSKVFLCSKKQTDNIKDFQSPNMAFLQPIYETQTNLFIFSEPDVLLTYDMTSQKIYHDSLINSHSSLQDFIKNHPQHNPRTLGIFVYNFNYFYKVLKDFNVISHDTKFHYLKNIQNRDAGLISLTNGKIFVAGGVGAGTSKETQLCFIYDPLIQEEKSEQSLPIPLRGLRLVEYQGSIFAVSGFMDSSDKYQEVFCFSFLQKNHEWISIGEMMQPTRYPCCFEMNGKLFAIGGEVVNEDEEVLTDHVQVMEFDNKVWSLKVVKYPHGAKNMGWIRTGGKVLVFGGEDNDGEVRKESYLFDGEEFVEKGKLPVSCAICSFEAGGVSCGRFGYVYTNSGVLLKVDLEEFCWEEVDQIEEEFSNRVQCVGVGLENVFIDEVAIMIYFSNKVKYYN